MSWQVASADPGLVARRRRSFGLGEGRDVLAVEIVSADLAQDGGPPPDVRCTLAQQGSGDFSPRVVSTSVCGQAWTPVWKETLRLELEPGTYVTSRGVTFDLVLWDDSAQMESGESSCLGELAIPMEDLLPPERDSGQVRSMALLQGTGPEARQVGTVFIRARRADGEIPRVSRSISRPSISKEPDMEAPPRPSGSRSASPRQDPGEQLPPPKQKSPTAEIGFFDGTPKSAVHNSRLQFLNADAGFRVLPIDGRGSQVFNIDVSGAEQKQQSISPARERSPDYARNSAGSPARSSMAESPLAGAKRASVLLLRAPPPGAKIVGEQVGVGVGLQMATSREFFISSIVDGTPAAEAAATDMLAVGDVVEAIDGLRCRGQPVEQVIAMMKGPAHTPVKLSLSRTGVSRAQVQVTRPSGCTSILLIRLGESFSKLAPQQNTFSAVLLHDLTTSSGSYSDRFRYAGIENHGNEIEVSVEVTEDNPGLDPRSSREICEHLTRQSSDVYSKLRQSPSMEHFRGIKHYLKHAAQGPLSAQLSYVASTPLSKLEAAMEAVKTSSVRRMLQEDNDPLMRFSPDVEMSIGSPASSLRMQSVAALQNGFGKKATEMAAVTSPRNVHVSIQDGHKELIYADPSQCAFSQEDENSVRQPRSARLDQTIYGTQFDLRHVYFRFAVLIVGIIAMGLILGSKENPIPWHWLAWSSILYAGTAPWSQYFTQFFAGGGGSPLQWISDLVHWRKRPFKSHTPFWWLVLSTFVCACLGDTLWDGAAMGYMHGGAVGAFAHAIYYIGIAIMFITIYRLRVHHPEARSMMQLVNICYGYEACGLYGGLVLYRILSLIWTGALTTGLLFVEYDQSMGIFWGALLCGAAPLFYTLMGGIRSLYSAHPMQAFIMFIFLIAMLCKIPNKPNWIEGRGSWTLSGGGDLVLVRFLQGSLSLPWVTAVLTDRAFLSTPGANLAAVLLGTFLAYCFSFMSSLLGIYTSYIPSLAVAAGSGGLPIPIAIGRYFGEAYYHLVVLMTIASSMGIIDSCLVSVSKLGGLEAFGLLVERNTQLLCAQPLSSRSPRITRTNVLVGRMTLMMVGGVGICCLASEAVRHGNILEARLSGIMTMGIAPPIFLMCVWRRKWKRSPTAFWMPVAVSLIIGILFATSTTCSQWSWGQCIRRESSFASNWQLGKGAYAYELGLSVYSLLIAVLACITGFLLDFQFRLPDSPEEANIIYVHAEKLAAQEDDIYEE